MNQPRYRGIECDQCGKPSETGLRLNFSVVRIYTKVTKKRDLLDDASFYADFCSKECMRKFLDKHYFEMMMEGENNE
jgi:endogenous inhibitor of DNA gyrase (YacG/DUF329 family)